MRQDAILEGFWIFQNSKYARFPNMQALHKVLNMPESGWIMPYGKVLTAWSTFHNFTSSSKYARAQNMARLWMRELQRVLNKPECMLIMTQYAWICLDNAKYDWMCQHIPGKTVLNMPKFWMCLMQYIA